jgi:hypothetical protein
MIESYGFSLNSVITALATLISVFIGSRLSSSQSGKAKIWDLRRAVYGTILSHLSNVESVCDAIDSYIEEDAYRYYQSEYRIKLDERIAEHMMIVHKTYNEEYLILSDDFIYTFNKFVKEMRDYDHDEPFPVDHEHFSSAVRKYRPKLLALGRKEMTGARFSWLRPWKWRLRTT